MAFSLPNIVIKPDLSTLFHGDCPLCARLALRLRNTKVPVWTHEYHRVPKMHISHWDAAIHYGIQLAQYCDQTRSFNAILRRLSPLCSLALRLRNTKVPVWTHASIGYPKMDISHWDAAIHYGVQIGFAQYCDQRHRVIAISRRWCPLFPYPMDSWVHTSTLVFLSLRAREHRGDNQPWNSGNSLWVWSQYWASKRHSELPRPNGWCPFSLPYGPMSPHRYFGVPES